MEDGHKLNLTIWLWRPLCGTLFGVILSLITAIWWTSRNEMAELREDLVTLSARSNERGERIRALEERDTAHALTMQEIKGWMVRLDGKIDEIAEEVR